MSEQLGNYHLLDPLGPGSLGPTYRARDAVAGRTVLVEEVSALIGRDPLVRKRFAADAEAAQALSHPNVLQLYELGTAGDRAFLVSEYATGKPLRSETEGQGLEPRQAVELGVQLADALSACHGLGLNYLDLTPDRVTLSTRGHAKLSGAGLSAWRLRAAKRDGADPTPVGPCLSPEQRQGDAGDHRSDLFALGVLLYRALVGRDPPSDGSGLRPADTVAGVPAELDRIVARVTAESPDERHQSALSLGAELRSVGAVLDVRSGDRSPPTTVTSATSAQDEGTRATGWLLGGVGGAVALLLWWLFG